MCFILYSYYEKNINVFMEEYQNNPQTSKILPHRDRAPGFKNRGSAPGQNC